MLSTLGQRMVWGLLRKDIFKVITSNKVVTLNKVPNSK